jgi:superfamily I DNA/RNA helicase
MSPEEAELNAAMERVLRSPSPKKLVVAGPGTGKTSLFRELLASTGGQPDRYVVLTFINNLRDDLEEDLAGLAQVFTLHSFCLGLLHRDATIRAPLSCDFRCLPGLAHLIGEDWRVIKSGDAPQFVSEMRELEEESSIPFYLARGEYYDAVDFDDTVYRVFKGFTSGSAVPDVYNLVLVDEYQDFNRLEAGFIDALAAYSPILIAGDDDQALYSQLRNATWDNIRQLSRDGEFEVFELPYCMRCPKVVVDAVNDVLSRARALHRLDGRIEKPYKYFPPVKRADSAKYPRIALVETSVQRANANYMGRYIATAVAAIPPEEIEEARARSYPAALVIAAQPYRRQIISHLENSGFDVEVRQETTSRLDRDLGLAILQEERDSNLGWRIILDADKPSFLRDAIAGTADNTKRIVDVLPQEYRESVLANVDTYEPPDESKVDLQPESESPEPLRIRVTSFEGAKGLSAQHVYIAGLHNNELPRDPMAIQDLEICKFVVALTRTRKRCSLIYTRNFAGSWRTRSEFIDWIGSARFERVRVDASYRT